MASKLPTVVVDLLTAREVLAVRGLHKGWFVNSLSGAVCSIGALRVAAYRSPNVTGNRVGDARDVLFDLCPRHGLIAWSDDVSTTALDVTSLFDDAASLALSEAAARGEYK